MARDIAPGNPSVIEPPPLPPKPGFRQQQNQTLLVILVVVALVGMTVEACFIFHLYATKDQSTPANEPQTAIEKQEKVDAPPKLDNIMSSKPMAQLTNCQKPINGVMLWNREPILHQVKHNEGKLIIETEGYYSIYSKINFHDDRITCTHSVLQTTDHNWDENLLLQSSWYRPMLPRQDTTDNSYLSGMFYLYKNYAVFVRVKNCTLVLSNAAENYFGVFMV